MANNVLTRIGTALGILKAHEGEYRDGPWHLPLTGGWLSQDGRRGFVADGGGLRLGLFADDRDVFG